MGRRVLKTNPRAHATYVAAPDRVADPDKGRRTGRQPATRGARRASRSLHLAALAAPRPPCSSPRPRPTPRAFPAPAGCSRGPKRLPRPSTSHAWQICSRSNRMLLVLLVIQQARRSRSSSSSSRRSLYCTRCRRSGQVARYLLELVQSSAVRQAASRPLSTCFRMAVPHTLD